MNVREQIAIANREIEYHWAEMDEMLAYREMLTQVLEQGIEEVEFRGSDPCSGTVAEQTDQ